MSMTSSKARAVALAAGLSFAATFGFGATPAAATEDRGAAIDACRAAIAAQLGVSADTVQFDQSSTRGARYDIRFDVRGAGAQDGRYACRYSRSSDSVVGTAAGTRANVGDAITPVRPAAAN